MDSATLDLHLQRLNELIFDEGKIVSCMSLASELNVGLADAKTVLETFAEDNKSKADVTATYILCGRLKENKGHGVHLAEHFKLSECRALYEKVSSEVIYSIQNFKQVDFNAIALSSPQAENWQGSIISKNCIKRNFVKKTLPPPTPAATTSSKPLPKLFASTEKAKTGESSPKQNNDQRSQKEIKPKQKNGGIGTFFSKMPPKAASKPTEQKSKSEFTKQKSESSENGNGTIENGISDVDMVDVSKEKTISKIENKSEKLIDDSQKNNGEKSEKKKSETSSSSKKRKKQSKNNESSKKRKRIQEICDSDSDDIFETEENEDVIERSDEDTPPPAPEVKHEPPPKNKRRKAVDKTYLDDEGFMVTTTEYIYETASEEEDQAASPAISQPKKVLTEKKSEEAPATKPKAGKGKNNKKAVTGKQQSIMSFFKKS